MAQNFTPNEEVVVGQLKTVLMAELLKVRSEAQANPEIFKVEGKVHAAFHIILGARSGVNQNFISDGQAAKFVEGKLVGAALGVKLSKPVKDDGAFASVLDLARSVKFMTGVEINLQPLGEPTVKEIG